MLWRDGAGTRRLPRPLHPPRHGALARLGRRRRARLPVPRLALRPDGACTRSRSSRTRRASPPKARARRSAARSATASSGSRSRSRASRCRTCRSSRRGRRDGRLRAVPWALRRLAPGRELHRLRPLPVRPSRPARRPGATGRPGSRGRDRGNVLHYASSGRRPGERRLPGLRQRGREAPSGGAATSCTCRTRSFCASAGAGRRGCCTSSPPAGRPGRCAGFLVIGRNYNLEQPDAVLQEFEESSSRRTSASSSRSGPSRCRSTSPPSSTCVRRGRRRLPARDARQRARAVVAAGYDSAANVELSTARIGCGLPSSTLAFSIASEL